MNDQKNTLLAIVLSALVLIGWQIFFGLPHMQQQQQQQQKQAQQPPGAPAQPGAPSTPGAPPQAPGPPGAAPVQPASREAALAASPRIRIDTPTLAGSIALKGGRIDDLSLIKYRETVDPASPAIVLLSPSGGPQPFYAEFGWTSAAGANVKMPDADTMWRQQGSGALSIDRPVTLLYAPELLGGTKTELAIDLRR